jgi:hypothetical protein
MSHAWRVVSRGSCMVVRLECAGHGGVNSGRAVARSSTRAVALCVITCPSSSSVDASHQCRSSTNTTSGCTALRDSLHCAKRSIVLRRCSSGLMCRGVGSGSPRKAASRATVSAEASAPSPLFSFPELLGRRVLGRERQPLRHHGNHRMERRAFGVRRRAAFEPRMGHHRQVLVELVDEARLPDPCLAEDDDGLPLAVLRPPPALAEGRQLDLAADEARQAARGDGEPAAYSARLHDPVERHRLAHALQHLRPAVFDHEHPGHQALRRGGDHHRVGLGRTLHARRDVRRLTEDLAAVRDHHRTGMEADAHGQARPVPRGEGGVERPHGVHDRQGRPERPFRVILARGGPAEVDEQTIAEFPGDVAAEARDGAGGGLLVLREEVAPLLGVELLRERRRAHQVAEEHRQLAALAGRHHGVGRGRRRRRAGRRRHGREPRTGPPRFVDSSFMTVSSYCSGDNARRATAST